MKYFKDINNLDNLKKAYKNLIRKNHPDCGRNLNVCQEIKGDLLENKIIPRLNTIESCYTATYNRYQDYADKMQSAFEDIELMKKVVAEHSKLLQKIS